MKKNLRKIGILAIVITVMTSCKKDQLIDDVGVVGNYDDGYFITNEGNFGTGNGSISFVSNEGVVENNVFENVNDFLIGDVVQSMKIIGDNAYVLVNSSAKIEVVSVDSINHLATIEGLVSPRYMTEVSEGKAYVSDWGINGVQVIDLITNTISSTIACGSGPEEIAISNGFAYVCNVGGWGLDNTITIINTITNTVETTLIVGDKPNSAVVDLNGAVWILTGGYTEWNSDWTAVLSESAGKLVKIVNNNIQTTYSFPIGNHPEDLVINESGNTLYYSDGSLSKEVYSFNIIDTELSSNSLINKSFYGLGCNDGYIYGTDAVDYVQQGWSFRYTENGVAVDSVQVGIIPGSYCFN